MKERPINLRQHEAAAIVAGRQTQLRRVVKGQKPAWKRISVEDDIKGSEFFVICGDREGALRPILGCIRCPYGQPGDRLWGRETHAIQHACEDDAPPFDDGRPVWRRSADDIDGVQPAWMQAHYKATDPAPDLCCEGCGTCDRDDSGPHWRSPIIMPRWASRIALDIACVRVERLKSISDDDLIAEGMIANTTARCIRGDSMHPPTSTQFADRWDSIHGPGSWDANPWVWVIEFRRIEATRSESTPSG